MILLVEATSIYDAAYNNCTYFDTKECASNFCPGD